MELLSVVTRPHFWQQDMPWLVWKQLIDDDVVDGILVARFIH